MFENKTVFTPHAKGLSLQNGIYYVIVKGILNQITISVKNEIKTVLAPTRNGVPITVDENDYISVRLVYEL
jgi:hypothetical protein